MGSLLPLGRYMAFSEMSLYYGADNRLHILRNFTNSDNTGEDNATLGSQPVLPEGGHAPKFEMRVTPNTGVNIIQNDFANWRSLGNGVGYVRHRVDRSDVDPPGSTSASVNLSVAVRRIAYNAEGVSGVVTFNNTITTQGDVGPGIPEEGTWAGGYVSAFSEGPANGNQGYYAESRYNLYANGIINQQTSTRGIFGENNTSNNVGSWLPVGTTVDQWEGRVSSVEIISSSGNYSCFPTAGPTAYAPMTGGLVTAATSSDGGTDPLSEGSVRMIIQLRLIANPSTVMTGGVILQTNMSL